MHPGGRTVLDAVEQAFDLPPVALGASRSVLNDYGNMSSGTVMFVLDNIMRNGGDPRAARLRHVFRAGPGRRDHDVPQGGVTCLREF